MRGEKGTIFGFCERRVKNRPLSEALTKVKSVKGRVKRTLCETEDPDKSS